MLMHPDSRPKPRDWDERKLLWRRIEHKYDGRRFTIVKNGDKCQAWGRKAHINEWDALPKYLLEKIHDWPDKTIVDGELWVPGKKAADVITYMREASEKLVFSPFAVPIYDGHDLRQEAFSVVDGALIKLGLKKPQVLVPIEITKEYLNRCAKALKIEGFILKTHHYGGWWKSKPTKTVDAIVIDTVAGKGKHAGRLGSLVVAVYSGVDLVTIANVGKGNDDDWRDEKRVLGRVVEVKYEELSKGKLKYGGSFERWRDDKQRSDCTIDQLS